MNDEGFDCWEFIAPAGFVFGNESRYRILESISLDSVAVVVDALSLEAKRS